MSDTSSIIAQVRERVQNPNMDMALNEIDRLRVIAGGQDVTFDMTDADAVLEYITALLDRIELLEKERDAMRQKAISNAQERNAAESRLAEAREEALEAAARIIDDNMLCGPEGVEVLHPRTNPGNKLGLAYAAAIRALKSGGANG